MSKIKHFNQNVANILKNLKKLVLAVAIFFLMIVSSQIKTYPHIPLKGLFEVLNVDDVCSAHTLLHSKWIENMYQYGPGKPHRKVETRRNREQWKTQDRGDAVANLIRMFWFRRTEAHQLLPTKFGCLANVPTVQLGKVFGKLIDCVYFLSSSRQVKSKCQEALIDELLKYDPEYKQLRQELTALWMDAIGQEYKLEDERFDILKQLQKDEQEEIDQIKEDYKIKECSEAIAKASKDWGKKKGFSRERKRLEREYKKTEYNKKVKAVRAKYSGRENKDVQKEYRDIQKLVRRITGNITKVIQRKRSTIKKELLDPIKNSLEFCQFGDVYMPRTTESILWALFFHKLDGLISLEDKIKAINDCIECIDDRFKHEDFLSSELGDLYNQEDFFRYKKKLKDLDVDKDLVKIDDSDNLQDDIFGYIKKFKKKIENIKAGKQVDVVCQDYDLALHYFISIIIGGKFSPAIAQGSYGYEYEPGKISHTEPNCHETATLDVLSVLWYNPQKKLFDDSLFSDHIIQHGQGLKKLREALKYFYLADEKGIKAQEYICKYEGRIFTSLSKLKSLGKISQEEVDQLDISEVPVCYIDRSEIKQEFTNIVSGLEGVIYCSESREDGKDFELDSDIRNVLAIFNYFYGTRAKNFEELEKDISTDCRAISFEPPASFGQDNSNNGSVGKIVISVSDSKNDAYFDMEMNVDGGHSHLFIADREKKGSDILKEGFVEKILNENGLSFCRRIAVLNLFTSKALLENEKIKWNLPALQSVYYTLEMKRVDVALDIIEDILVRRAQYYNDYKEMICNLIEKIPHNDQALKERLVKIIIKSGFYEKEPFLKKIVTQVLDDPLFYQHGFGIENIFELALGKYRDIVLQIMHHPGFDYWSKAVGLALQKSLGDLALQLLGRPKCNFRRNGVEDGLVHGLQHGLEDIVLKVISHPRFNFGRNHVGLVLQEAMKRGSKKIISEIIKHDFFPGDSGYSWLLRLSLERGYKDVALELAKKTLFFGDMKESFKYALEKGYTDVAAAIVANPEFDLEEEEEEEEFLWDRMFSVEKSLKENLKEQEKVEDFSHWSIGKLIGKILKEGPKEVIVGLFKNPRLSFKRRDVQDALVSDLKQGEVDLLIAMLDNSGFAQVSYEFDQWAIVFEKALEVSNQKAIFVILDHPQVSWGSVLSVARDKDRRDILQKIVMHPKFDLDYVDMFSFKSWIKEQYEKYIDIVLAIVKNSEFQANHCDMPEILSAALANEAYHDVAFAIIEHPNFTRWEKALDIALENGVSQEIINVIKSIKKEKNK